MLEQADREKMRQETVFEARARVRFEAELTVPYGKEVSFEHVAGLVPDLARAFLKEAVKDLAEEPKWRDGFGVDTIDVEVLEIRGLWKPAPPDPVLPSEAA